MGAASLVPLPTDRLVTDRVAAALRDAIVTGRFKPGERLVETALARQLTVSRSPIREALRRLALEGLVVGQPHRGFRVVSMTEEDIRELYLLRTTLEGLAARLAVGRMGEHDIRQLRAIVAGMQSAAGGRQTQRLSALDIQFHELVVRASGHSRLIQILERLRLQIRESIAINVLYDDPQEVASQHEALLALIESADPDALAAALEEHIAQAGAKAREGVRRAQATQRKPEPGSVNGRRSSG